MSTINRPLVAKVGDTAPTQRTRLTDHNGDPANLTGATVTMHVRGHTTPIPCTVVDPATDGLVRFDRSLLPDPGDDRLETVVEFRVAFTGGAKQTFPEHGYQRFVLWPAL